MPSVCAEVHQQLVHLSRISQNKRRARIQADDQLNRSRDGGS